jgi:hypothetical protein
MAASFKFNGYRRRLYRLQIIQSHRTVKLFKAAFVVFSQRTQKTSDMTLFTRLDPVLIFNSVINPLRVALNNLYMEFL